MRACQGSEALLCRESGSLLSREMCLVEAVEKRTSSRTDTYEASSL